jgi:hypothetical protein
MEFEHCNTLGTVPGTRTTATPIFVLDYPLSCGMGVVCRIPNSHQIPFDLK